MQIADLLLMVVLVNGQTSLDAEYRVDFRDGNFDNRQLSLIGAGSSRLIKAGPSGLLIKTPAKIAINEVGFAAKCVVKGDFEITASYEILDLAKPDSGYGVGPCMHVLTESKAEHAATLSRLQRVKEGDVYAAHSAWYADAENGPREREHRVRLFDTKADSGKLRMVRSGTKLQYLVADERSEEFRQVDQVEFTDADVELIRISLNRNGAQSDATVLWKDFSIRAKEISDLPRRRPGLGVLFWMISGLVVVCAAFGTWYRRRARST